MPVLVRGSSVARAASRFTLEATDACVERQQDIGEENAVAEVIESDGDGWMSYMGRRCVGADDEVLRVIVEAINAVRGMDGNSNSLMGVVRLQRATG
jgi:hypothetical protein